MVERGQLWCHPNATIEEMKESAQGPMSEERVGIPLHMDETSDGGLLVVTPYATGRPDHVGRPVHC